MNRNENLGYVKHNLRPLFPAKVSRVAHSFLCPREYRAERVRSIASASKAKSHKWYLTVCLTVTSKAKPNLTDEWGDVTTSPYKSQLSNPCAQGSKLENSVRLEQRWSSGQRRQRAERQWVGSERDRRGLLPQRLERDLYCGWEIEK